MLTSAGVRGDLGNGLALCQSHSYRLSREEAAFPQLRGAWVVNISGGCEGTTRGYTVLHNLHTSKGGERGEDVSYTSRAWIWGCIPGGSARFTSQ